MWVINLLFKKYNLENVALVIKVLNTFNRCQSRLDKDLLDYIDLEMYTDQELLLKENSFKNKSGKKQFRVASEEDGRLIKASEDTSVYDFKRLILSSVKKPFFFTENYSNDKMVRDLYQEHDAVQICFKLEVMKIKIKEFTLHGNQADATFTVKKKKTDTVENMLKEIKKHLKMGDSEALSLILPCEVDPTNIRKAMELNPQDTLKQADINRFTEVYYVKCQMKVAEIKK